jgi:hypothetical protein
VAEDTKVLSPVVPEGHWHIEGLHDNETALAYHLAHSKPQGHAAGDWRQFDRMGIGSLRESHENLHHGLAVHEDLGDDPARWHRHMRERHLTEPVRGSLGLVKVQHDVLHPSPGHLSPDRLHTSGPQYSSQDVDQPANATKAFAADGTTAGRFGPDAGKSEGQRQAKMNEKLKYAESCAATARNRGGFWLNAINAYAEIGELLRQGYPMPDGWKPRG